MSAFGIGEAEAADGAIAKTGDLGEGVGFDLSQLSYLMSSDNEAKLQALLDSMDSNQATSLGHLAQEAPNLAKLTDDSTVAGLIEAANAPAPAPGVDGTDGEAGEQGERGSK